MNSKALAKAIPGKILTMAQSIGLAVLLLVICFASFGSMFNMDVNLDAEARVKVVKMINDMSGDGVEDVEIPEKIEVSLPFMIKSIGSIGDVIKSASQMAKDADEADVEEKVEDAEDLAKDVMSQDFVNLIVFFMALFSSFGSSFVLGICHIFLLSLVFIVPITAIVNLLIGGIGLLRNLQEPDVAMTKVSKGFSGVLGMFPLLLLVKVLIPELQLGGGIVTILVMCCIGLAISLVCSRLKYYEKPDFKYLNVLQILSACSLGAFLIFFFNMANSGIMATIFKRLGSYAVKEVGSTLVKQKESPDMVPMLLVLVFVVVLFMIVNYVVDILTRLTCMSKSKADTHIVTTAIGLAIIVIPVVLMNSEKFALKLSDADSSAFTMVCVGLVLMLVIEIALKILSKSLCSDVSADRRKEIVTGAYVYVDTEEAPAVAEEAPAEEAAAEEAPAVAEEAPAEEAPAEEEAK